MVQSVDNRLLRPVYNAVNINIRKPEVNSEGNKDLTVVNDNGIYNAVKINIDNPTVNPKPKKMIYDYPEAKGFVSYEMTGFLPVKMPEVVDVKDENAFAASDKKFEVPEPNYTTTDAEKGEENNTAKLTENDSSNIKFQGNENKKIEIVPGEEIKPEVDIHLVVSNLNDDDYDKQALQMEEITRVSLNDPAKAVPYIVREVFSELIDITKQDTASLQVPTKEQIEARKKLIENVIALENNPQLKELPNKLDEEQTALALKLSPMEMAERNKEYALYTIAVLAKVYTDEVLKQTGNVVPMTEIPGISAVVDCLRYNPNSGVKVAALDALAYVARPEYKEEMTEIFSIAESDNNPMVSKAAAACIEKINQK